MTANKCIDCMYFVRRKDGSHGGVKGGCRIKTLASRFYGNSRACKHFVKKEGEKDE